MSVFATLAQVIMVNFRREKTHFTDRHKTDLTAFDFLSLYVVFLRAFQAR